MESGGHFVEGGMLSIKWQDIVLLKTLRLPCSFNKLKNDFILFKMLLFGSKNESVFGVNCSVNFI